MSINRYVRTEEEPNDRTERVEMLDKFDRWFITTTVGHYDVNESTVRFTKKNEDKGRPQVSASLIVSSNTLL